VLSDEHINSSSEHRKGISREFKVAWKKVQGGLGPKRKGNL
jgi:hypothetical protein